MAKNVIDTTGYRQAILHLAWFRDHQDRHLLFGMVELRPIEFPDALGCKLQKHRVISGSRKHLHYRRFVLPASKALDWYSEAAQGRPLTLPRDPSNPTPGDGSILNAGPFDHEPPWPQFVTSNELPFAPDWMTGARTHFLFPKDALPSEITGLIQVEKNHSQLQDWLVFDLVDAYREYQGAMCVVAPNPIFRSIEKTHLDPPHSDSAETVAYKLVPRHGQLLKGLNLSIANERLCGRMAPITHKFGNQAIAVLDFPTRIYKEGRSVTHSEHGLLYWHPPTPLIRRMRIRMEVSGRPKRVQVPAAGRRRPAERYEVSEVLDVLESVVGEEYQNPFSRIVDATSRRSRRQSAKSHDQEWFYRTPHEATQYVRLRIADARHTVLIVDPYFAGRELLSFGHAIRRTEVHLRILSSTAALQDSNLGPTPFKSGSQFLQILNTTFGERSVKPQIRMLGDPPAVHDRFLVIDEDVWFSGNSLTAIGDRAGMIVKLPDPEPAITRLEAFWAQARSLADWLTDHAAQNAVPADVIPGV